MFTGSFLTALRTQLSHYFIAGISTTACILIFSIFAFALLFPRLDAVAVPDILSHNTLIALEICFASLSFLSIVFLWLCRLVDPGLIPPLPLSTPLDALTVALLRSHTAIMDNPTRQIPSSDPSQPPITESFCQLCRIWRSSHTGHCYQYGYCYDRFDHFCGVIGVPIAKNNHKFFVLFITSVGCAAALLWSLQVVWLFSLPFYASSSWSTWDPYVALFTTFLSFYPLMVFCFCCFHWQLLFNNLTTRQLLGRQNRRITCQNISLLCKLFIETLHIVFCSENKWVKLQWRNKEEMKIIQEEMQNYRDEALRNAGLLVNYTNPQTSHQVPVTIQPQSTGAAVDEGAKQPFLPQSNSHSILVHSEV
jgi:hypothetical protein